MALCLSIRLRVIGSGEQGGNHSTLADTFPTTTEFFFLVFTLLIRSEMRAAKTPMERLEFGLRWEAYRLAYFSSIGHSTKVAALTAKLQTLEEDLRRESYQFSDTGQTAFH